MNSQIRDWIHDKVSDNKNPRINNPGIFYNGNPCFFIKSDELSVAH